MADETPHIHGTPIVDEPQSVRDLFNWAYAKFKGLAEVPGRLKDLEARVSKLEKPKGQ